MRRRRALVYGCVLCGADLSFAQGAAGCMLAQPLEILGVERSDFHSVSQEDSIKNSTGDPTLDRALGKALARMAQQFGVNPSFGFYREASGPNALASKETTTSGTWGSIVVGRKLFQRQMTKYNDAGMSLLGVIAHEFGHIIQYKRDLTAQLIAEESTVRRVELHADFLAGWYLGTRKRSDSSISLWATGDTFNSIGDYEYTNPMHHGTPAQRIAFAEGGFKLGVSGDSSIDSAVASASRFLASYPFG